MKLKIMIMMPFFTFSASVAMQPIVVTEDAKKEARKIADRSLSKYEQKAAELLSRTFDKEIEDRDWHLLSSICKPKYALLLDRLLTEKKISPHTRVKYAPCTLLTQAIHKSRNLYKKVTDYAATDKLLPIEVLLTHGADPNELIININEINGAYQAQLQDFVRTHLSCAVAERELEQVRLLLHFNADPNQYSNKQVPLIYALCDFRRCKNLTKKDQKFFEEQMRQYQIIKELLKKGADIYKSSESTLGKITTPMEYAQQYGCSEIVDLFEQNQGGKK